MDKVTQLSNNAAEPSASRDRFARRLRGSRWRPSDVASPALLLVLGVAIILSMQWIDVPLAAWVKSRWPEPRSLPRLVQNVLFRSEVFGHPVMCVALMAAFFVLRPSHRWRLPRFGGCVLGAGLAAASAKLLVLRWRPNSLDLAAPGLETFGPWLPPRVSSDMQSFPSGHTAVAVALAIALTWMLPRGRGLFLCFAVLVMLQRGLFLEHFLSDILAGALVACLWCRICFNPRLLGGAFHALETRLASPPRGDQRTL